MTEAHPVRVLRIIARMNVGGPARQVVALHDPTSGLGPLGYEQRLLVGTVASDEVDELELRGAGIDATVITGLGRAIRLGGDVQALAAIATEIRRFRPHIVHTHTAKAGGLGRVATWATSPGTPTVHTFHGHLLSGYFPRAIQTGVVTAERLMARRTTRLVAVGSRVRDDLLAARIGTAEQFAVVPPGVRLPPSPPPEQAREQLGLESNSGLIVGFAGRLTGIKRLDRLLAATSELLRRGVPVTVLVAGTGALEAEMRHRATELGLSGSVRFLGTYANMAVFWAACDVAVITSDNEGMPMALIEAALIGKPSVTTDVGSAREVVVHGRTGFVVPPDAVAVAEALSKFVDPKLRHRMGTEARVVAAGRFSTDRLVGDTDSIYREMGVATIRQ